MDRLQMHLNKLEEVTYNGKRSCIEALDNRLQDILYYLEAINHRASGELIELKGCSWVLHERYHMDTEEQLMWTFHHTKHKIVKCCSTLLQTNEIRNRIALEKEQHKKMNY